MHSSLCALALCAPQGGGIVSSGQSGIMRPSVHVVVQIISRIRSGKQPEFVTCWIIVCGCRFLTAPLPRVFTSESAVLVHGNLEPGCGLAARGLTVRRPL